MRPSRIVSEPVVLTAAKGDMGPADLLRWGAEIGREAGWLWTVQIYV